MWGSKEISKGWMAVKPQYASRRTRNKVSWLRMGSIFFSGFDDTANSRNPARFPLLMSSPSRNPDILLVVRSNTVRAECSGCPSTLTQPWPSPSLFSLKFIALTMGRDENMSNGRCVKRLQLRSTEVRVALLGILITLSTSCDEGRLSRLSFDRSRSPAVDPMSRIRKRSWESIGDAPLEEDENAEEDFDTFPFIPPIEVEVGGRPNPRDGPLVRKKAFNSGAGRVSRSCRIVLIWLPSALRCCRLSSQPREAGRSRSSLLETSSTFKTNKPSISGGSSRSWLLWRSSSDSVCLCGNKSAIPKTVRRLYPRYTWVSPFPEEEGTGNSGKRLKLFWVESRYFNETRLRRLGSSVRLLQLQLNTSSDRRSEREEGKLESLLEDIFILVIPSMHQKEEGRIRSRFCCNSRTRSELQCFRLSGILTSWFSDTMSSLKLVEYPIESFSFDILFFPISKCLRLVQDPNNASGNSIMALSLNFIVVQSTKFAISSGIEAILLKEKSKVLRGSTSQNFSSTSMHLSKLKTSFGITAILLDDRFRNPIN